MNFSGPYEDDNPFARILAGSVDCARIYEDEVALAFLDTFPQSPGHTLVILKRMRACTLFDMPDFELGPFMIAVRRVAHQLVNCLRPDGVGLYQYNGAAAGQTIFHLHIHLIPRYRDVPLWPHGKAGAVDLASLNTLAEQLRSSSSRSR